MKDLEAILQKFHCTKDKDIQYFLREKAIVYENRNWSSTYLLIDDEKLLKDGFIHIEGYFSLANKILQLSDEVSNVLRKKMAGGIKMSDNHKHFVLIGQLGKYIDETKENKIYGKTTAYDLLDKAFEIIYQVKERIVCRNVLVECKDNRKIRQIYENYGFKELQRDNELIQYFKII